MAGAGRMLGCCRRRKLPGPGWPPRRCLLAGPVGPPRAPPGAGASVRPDPAVVGGGLRPVGRAAGQGADPGHSVILLKADRDGWAATGRNGGFCTASLTHDEANGCSGCAPSTGSARMRTGDNPPVSSAAGRMPRDTPLATARYTGMEPSQTVPGDRRVL